MRPAIKPKVHIYEISFSMKSFKTDVKALIVDKIVGNMLYCYITDPAEEIVIPKQNINEIVKDVNNEVVFGYFSDLKDGYIACYSAAKEYFENKARSYELLAVHMDYEIKELKKRGEQSNTS